MNILLWNTHPTSPHVLHYKCVDVRVSSKLRCLTGWVAEVSSSQLLVGPVSNNSGPSSQSSHPGSDALLAQERRTVSPGVPPSVTTLRYGLRSVAPRLWSC